MIFFQNHMQKKTVEIFVTEIVNTGDGEIVIVVENCSHSPLV